jgi:hypothetical protein
MVICRDALVSLYCRKEFSHELNCSPRRKVQKKRSTRRRRAIEQKTPAVTPFCSYFSQTPRFANDLIDTRGGWKPNPAMDAALRRQYL